MKRRELIRYGGASLVATVATQWLNSNQYKVRAQTNPLTVQYLGHSCFLFVGGGTRVLVNPFRPIGCTAGYRPPQVEADVVLISSYLLDEGAAESVPGRPRVLFNPGDYNFSGIKFQGIGMAHDREGGRQFGTNVAWRWTQAGVNILHLGGAAAPIELEQKILLGSPDLVFVPVGGGVKNYNAQEAKQAVNTLNPKVVVPTQYLTAAADEANCNIEPVDQFVNLLDGTPVNRLNSDRLTLSPDNLPSDTTVKIMAYNF